MSGIESYDEKLYDNPNKSCGWHTALYYYAEHVRTLSRGTINHKTLYAHISTKGHYINHENPLIRKRTAAALSRLIHSSRYAEDLRASYLENDQVFDEAALWLLEGLRAGSGCDDNELATRFAGPVLLDVERGLNNERASGREDLNPARAVNEVQTLTAWWKREGIEDYEKLITAASSGLFLMTFGHLDESFVGSLVDETPLIMQTTPSREASSGICGACLVKYVRDTRAVSDVRFLDEEHAFTVGRYSDCDAIETNPYVSRLHCVIRRDGDRWILKDMDSLHGTMVFDAQGNLVFDSHVAGIPSCELKFGQRIVLAQSSTYWFCARDNRLSSLLLV